MPFPDLTETQEASLSEAAERLLAMPGESSRQSFIRQNPQLLDRKFALYLTARVPQIGRDDLKRALELSALASWVAEALDDDYCRARSARAMGHVLQLKGRLPESLAEYDKALALLATLKLDTELGITLSGSLQPLILLGNYEEARAREEKAREIFKAHGDELRLARLDANLGNILHRQDRFEEALVLYGRAEQSFERLDSTDDLALVLNNLAVCFISVREFPNALKTYQRLRSYCSQRQLHLLALQADYNIAYLHYLQGDYGRALHLYREARMVCTSAGDMYHAALCDLDQAEIHLHLNAYRECRQLAQAALQQFETLKMKYEGAKACTFLGLAASIQADSQDALQLLAKSRELFQSEENWTWVALVDLYRAMVLFRSESPGEALKVVTSAQQVLSHSTLKDKAVLADLLRSLLHLELGDSTPARYWAEVASERVENPQLADLRYLVEFILSVIAERDNDTTSARQHYERAKKASAAVVSARQREDTRPSLLKNRDTLYAHLIFGALRVPLPAAINRARSK